MLERTKAGKGDVEGGPGIEFFEAETVFFRCHEKDVLVPVPTLSGVCGKFGGYEGCYLLRGRPRRGWCCASEV